MRAYSDRWNTCVPREKSERYFCNPPTSGTRKRCPIFRYGQVGGDSFNSRSFHLAPSSQVSVSVPVSATFSVSRGTSSTAFTRRNPRERSLPEPESFADRSHVHRLNYSPPTLSPFFSFACNPSHSSSWLRFVKVCVSTFIVRHDTEIYPYSLSYQTVVLLYH